MTTPKKVKIPEIEKEANGKEWTVYWSLNDKDEKIVGLALTRLKEADRQPRIALIQHDGTIITKELV